VEPNRHPQGDGASGEIEQAFQQGLPSMSMKD
jgi:hypothetical protein